MAIRHPKCFPHGPCGPCGVCGVSRGFPRLSPGGGQVPYVLLTRAPVAGGVLPRPAAPRLACVRPVASVHPEPGSNSPLLLYLLFLFSRCSAGRRLGGGGAGQRGGRPGRMHADSLSSGSLSVSPVPNRRGRSRRSPSLAAPLKGRHPRLCHIVCSIISKVCAAFARRSCKGNNFSRFRQNFFYRLGRREPPFPVCGCKGTTKNRYEPNFSTTFFKKFSHRFTNYLCPNPVARTFFSPKNMPYNIHPSKSPKKRHNPVTLFNITR